MILTSANPQRHVEFGKTPKKPLYKGVITESFTCLCGTGSKSL